MIFDRNLEPGLADTMLDAEQLKRVFVNLIENAIEAFDKKQEEKRILITARHDKARDLIIAEVSDNGNGIPPSDLQKLFQPYFSTKGRGTGLGLAIVRRIVSEHHGKINVVSNMPKGAKFIIELPVWGKIMAVWQFWFSLVPRSNLIDYFGKIPKVSDDDIISDLTEGITLPRDYREILKALGSGDPLDRVSDSANWGDYDKGTHLTIFDLSTDRTYAWGRINASQWNHDFAAKVVGFANRCDCLFFTGNDTIIEPNVESLFEELKSSRAFRFCNNPREYLQGEEVARLNEEIKKKLSDV